MHTRALDFNRRAVAWARANGKPLVGNTDLHLLGQMGSTYSMVDAEPDADADHLRRDSPGPRHRPRVAAAVARRTSSRGCAGRNPGPIPPPP